MAGGQTLKAVAIIAEYNPFHHGHAYQLSQAKAKTGADVTIAIMSGQWLQRGEPAILDKWTRTSLALANGVDLVVELPVASALQPAHLFARGGVALAAALNARWLAFGSEHPAMDYATLMAHLPEDPRTFKRFDQTYASLFLGHLEATTGIRLQAANDLLGFFYSLANQDLDHPLTLVPIQRIGQGHHETSLVADQSIASATAIRQAAYQHDWSRLSSAVPATTLAALQERQVSWEDFWPLLRYQLLASSSHRLGEVYGMSEGVQYRLQRLAAVSEHFADFMRAVKTKRYTYTRLQRQASYALLMASADDMQQPPGLIRVLGFSSLGRAYLNQEKKRLRLPLVARVDRDLTTTAYALDARVSQIWNLVAPGDGESGHPPIMI